MDNKKVGLTIGIGLIVLGLIVFFILTNPQSPKQAPNPTVKTVVDIKDNDSKPIISDAIPQINETDMSGSETVETVTNLALNFSPEGLEPKELRARVGDQIKLEVSSTDVVVHTLAFLDSELEGVRINVGPTDTRTLNFTAPAEAGEYKYLCTVAGHETEMGTLIVR